MEFLEKIKVLPTWVGLACGKMSNKKSLAVRDVSVLLGVAALTTWQKDKLITETKPKGYIFVFDRTRRWWELGVDYPKLLSLPTLFILMCFRVWHSTICLACKMWSVKGNCNLLESLRSISDLISSFLYTMNVKKEGSEKMMFFFQSSMKCWWVELRVAKAVVVRM